MSREQKLLGLTCLGMWRRVHHAMLGRAWRRWARAADLEVGAERELTAKEMLDASKAEARLRGERLLAMTCMGMWRRFQQAAVSRAFRRWARTADLEQSLQRELTAKEQLEASRADAMAELEARHDAATQAAATQVRCLLYHGIASASLLFMSTHSSHPS